MKHNRFIPVNVPARLIDQCRDYEEKIVGAYAAYRRMRRQAVVQKHINEALEDLSYDEDEDKEETPVPADLKTRIAKAHKATRTQTWDEALREIVDSDGDGSAS